jgi:hypothetical protein
LFIKLKAQSAVDQFSTSIAVLSAQARFSLQSRKTTINRQIHKQRKFGKLSQFFSRKNSSHFVDFSQRSLAPSFYLHFHIARFDFHTKNFSFIFVGETRKFPHEKYFPNDWFSLRLHLHDSRRVFFVGQEKERKKN